jgi:PadR family transcriptional regulator PadR
VIRMPAPDRKLITREILLGFWKVHILHHAAEHPIVGQWLLGELRRHGYDLSPGTLYPLLKRMERNGWLRCEVESSAGPRARRYYFLTQRGRAVLNEVAPLLLELHHEVIEEPKLRTSNTSRARSAVQMRGSREPQRTEHGRLAARARAQVSRRRK